MNRRMTTESEHYAISERGNGSEKEKESGNGINMNEISEKGIVTGSGSIERG